MNREILFRGKRIDNGEWVEGFYYEDIWGDGKSYIIYDETEYEIIPETIGQCTGLKDKNGTRIFDDCICNVCRGVDIETGVIFYDERVGAFGIIYTEKECNLLFDIFMSKDKNVWIEVIGNIHDNPELLKGAGENDRP